MKVTDYEAIQFRSWCVDYSLRTGSSKNKTPDKVIRDAKKYEKFIFDAKSANILSIKK